MNKGLAIAVCAAVGAIVGVALAEWITTNYPLRMMIVGLGGAIGGAVGSVLAGRQDTGRR